MKLRSLYILALLIAVLASCRTDSESNKPSTTPPQKKGVVKVPVFNADSAYNYLVQQLDFGYRIPGTKEHEACKDWIVAKTKSFGLKVQVQKFSETIHTGEKMPGYNIIAQFKPDHGRRVVLAAHWDSRYTADKDPDESNHSKPIMGADDGASGVANLLEIARLISENDIDLGVDFIFFDLEDQGAMGENQTETWALGSQYWANNMVPKNYKADFGILLDMVGAKGARFGYESYSNQYAGRYLEKIWKLAQNMGYSDYFQVYNAGGVADDHVYMNKAGIPTVDIINLPENGQSAFGHYHHTIADNIDIIDKRTLRVVGQVVTAVLYRYSDGSL